jgi:sugar/nucleoside kinase (ribokinase family)
MKRTQLAQKLLLRKSTQEAHVSFFVGFDGFIDDILRVVKVRYSKSDVEFFSTLSDFGQQILSSHGKGTNFELASFEKKLGGNGPILANALGLLGREVTVVGAFGLPEIDPIFSPLLANCRKVISIAPAGITEALEFGDGKIMLGKHAPLSSLVDELLKIPKEKLQNLLDPVDFVASCNWTMLYGMTEFWQYLIESILPILSKKKRIFFFDLADPLKRTEEDLGKALFTIRKFKEFGKVILGVNELEAHRLLNHFKEKETSTLAGMCENIALHTGFQGIIIHTKDAACGFLDDQTEKVDGPWCPDPKLSTGGGDNFNAGFLFALSLGMSLEEALTLGVATSGYYVRAAHSPTVDELAAFLRKWDSHPDPATLTLNP